MHLFTQLRVLSKKKSIPILLLLFMQLLLVESAAGQSAFPKISTPVTLTLSNGNLDQALIKLNGQAGYRYIYDNVKAKTVRIGKLSYHQVALGKVLQKLQEEAMLSYSIDGNSIVVRINEHTTPNKKEQGKISGKVLDEKGESLPGASVKVIELQLSTQTSVDGNYSLNLPPGSYTLEISYISYKSQRITGISVFEEKNTPLDIAMKTSSDALNEVVISASYRQASIEGLYARQKNNAGMSDGITAEQISRTPDNNTAQVLKRVSGLQVSQNKYVVVRGLSDRYNNVLLNGNQLPSTEPNRRDFAFDMIPSGLVDQIVVNKTATPDLTGEFTGGLVQVSTKDIPDENFITLSVGSGFNSRSTGKDFIGGKRASSNYFGFAGNDQKKPEGMSFSDYNVLANKIIDNKLPVSAEERQKVNQFLGQFPDNWAMRRYKAQPIQNYALTVGQNIPFKQSRLGVIGALTYRNEQTADLDDRYSPTVYDYKGNDYEFTTLLGGSLNLGYTFGQNKLALKNTYNRRLTDKLYQYQGVDIMSSKQPQSNYAAQTLINELFQSSLSGEHAFGKTGIKLDFNAALSTLERDQPNSRIMSRNGSTDPKAPEDYRLYRFSDYQQEYGSVFYSNLSERRYAYQANLQIPFKLLNRSHSFKTGYQGSYRKATYGADSYRIRIAPGVIENDFNGFAYTDVYNKENFNDQKLLFLPYIGAGEKVKNGSATGYNGSQNLNAYYGMLDLKPLEKLRLIGGFRLEQNLQKVFTSTARLFQDRAGEHVDSLITVKKNDVLPSVNAIYALTPKMNVRAAFYKTVARPDLRELSFFSYFDFDIFRTISGTDLKSTQITNYDLRYEFYPSPDEIITVSGFYKKFLNPIERMIIPTSAKPSIIYQNLKSAKDLGFEVDFRKSLNFISSASGIWKNLYLSGSFTWVDASVDLGSTIAMDASGKPIESKRRRPLYGQSPYIINAGINYNGKHFGFNAVYNRYGKRIVASTAYPETDEYEHPRDVLDIQLSYKFLKKQNAEFRFNISDLLAQQLITYSNQYGPDHPVYKERDPSVERYPGNGAPPLPADQLDPKGTSYNAPYDNVTFRRKAGTNYSLNFIYRF